MSGDGNRPDAPSQRWSVETIFERFESRTNLERTAPQLRLYRLERMEKLLTRLDDVHRALPIVHLAGSKGKGSTAAYVASLLAAAGYRVGLYTSPHVRDYRERFNLIAPGTAVGGERVDAARDAAFPDADGHLVEQGRRVWSIVEAMIGEGAEEDDLPTTFELLTALAFCYFPAAGCDWIVLETGMGGRLDATNVCLPQLTMITRIELEHTEYLGDTVEKIAAEKAGIIKEGVPLLLAPQASGPDGVFDEVAAARSAPVTRVAELSAATTGQTGGGPFRGETVTLPPWAGAGVATLGMLGRVHRTNAAMALEALHNLARRDAAALPDSDSIRRALQRTRLPGRGEVLGELILDGAHTPESAANLASSLRRALPAGEKIPVIIGIVAGKNVEGIARALSSVASRFIVSRPGSFKPGDPVEVTRRIEACGFGVEREEDPRRALDRARTVRDAGKSREAPVLVTGSFYMVAEIRRLVLP
ncbi:MAG: hypothetical protein MI724_02815 [Spirochaetales bacterium]|nr:hypothetical protein [Spirochaetales bacterium]